MAEGVLKPALDGLDAELVVLAEPFDPNLDELAEALEALAQGPKLALWLEFHDAGPALERGAAELPVDGLGIDFFATHIEAVPAGFDKLLLAGVIDGRSSVPEEPREIAAFVDRLEVERIALVPNGDLQYVSQQIAQEKLARLGKAKTATTEAAA
jgi:methionine synthase II (cobalamin-independent)